MSTTSALNKETIVAIDDEDKTQYHEANFNTSKFIILKKHADNKLDSAWFKTNIKQEHSNVYLVYYKLLQRCSRNAINKKNLFSICNVGTERERHIIIIFYYYSLFYFNKIILDECFVNIIFFFPPFFFLHIANDKLVEVFL